MGLPIGLSGLASGFMQGLDRAEQKKRQDVIDQREAERFDMEKQRFADNQKANALSLEMNEFNFTNSKADRERAKAIQQKDDDFKADWQTFGRPFAMGDDQAGYAALEQVFNKQGYLGKGEFLRNSDGSIKIGKGGSVILSVADANGKTKIMPLTKNTAIKGFINGYDPKAAYEYELKTKAELAKENREEQRDIKKLRLQHKNAVSLEGLRQSGRLKELDARMNLKDPKNHLSKAALSAFSDVQEIIDPFTKQKKLSKPIFNQQKYNDFALFAHQNNLNPDDNTYALWLQNRQVVPNGLTIKQPATQGNKLIDFVKGKNITTQEQLNETVSELRQKGWNEQQINEALDEAGI